MEMNKMLKGALAGVVLYVSAGYNMDQTKLIQHDNDIPRDVPSEYKNFKFDEEIPNPRGPCFAWCGSTGPVPPIPINDYDGLTAKNILGTENIKPVIDDIVEPKVLVFSEEAGCGNGIKYIYKDHFPKGTNV